MDISKIKPGLMVHVQDGTSMGVRGDHVGTVDHMDGGQYIKLKRTDSADGNHRWVPIDWVNQIDDKAVYLKCTLEDFEDNVLHTPPSGRKVA
jgi:hypothetical protein